MAQREWRARPQASRRAYYQSHRLEVLAKRRAYRVAHRDRVEAQQRTYREAHREEYLEYQRRYYQQVLKARRQATREVSQDIDAG